MSGWIVWLVAACLLGIGEMLTTSFFLAPFAAGALLAALLAGIGAGEIASWAAFVAVSVVMLLGVRPIARSHVRTPPAIRTGSAALVGQPAFVVERIANGEGVGCIRVGGELWTARALDEDEVIERGTRVEIVDIKGATALVTE